jgi:phenylalanyl-tRNA synthetase beta chain
MIVTRTWLEEFIDLEGIGDDLLYDTFNKIGLEVDSFTKYVLPEKVLIGRLISCEKHPDADKLNVCKVDVGTEVLQIVCGAANVTEAEYVAVATIGAVLPGNFVIRPAKLRGVESHGMICSSKELGLPETEDGIMILDESVGEMVPGRELGTYGKIADTVIELELTANRGDCLSVHGIARDLRAALEREIYSFRYRPRHPMSRGIARMLELHTKGNVEADLGYMMMDIEKLESSCLLRLRLAFVGESGENTVEKVLTYATHATGVVLRAYDAERLKNRDGKIPLEIREEKSGEVDILSDGRVLSHAGISQNREFVAGDPAKEVLCEASYLDPDMLVPAVAENSSETDRLYYRSSRGSEPDLMLGMMYFMKCCDALGKCCFTENPLKIESNREEKIISVNVGRLNAVIGQKIAKGTVHSILKRLGFSIHKNSSSDVFGATVPAWRHDIRNIHDVAEEVLRIVGINNIRPVPLEMTEANHLTVTTHRYRIKRDIRQRATGVGFYEAVTYAFSEKKKLEHYGFPVLEENVDLLNPIVKELNTMRSTLTINMLEAASRNVNYGKKRISLFEIGSVFDRKRKESEKAVFLWSGDAEDPGVLNHGKPPSMDFQRFVYKLGSVIGTFDLEKGSIDNRLVHPYQSAVLFIGGKEAGWLGKLHPDVEDDFGLEDTFIAELDFDILVPLHRNAGLISNFQGVYKDLSLLVDKALPYREMGKVLEKLDEPILKRFFPIDRYEDDTLGDAKSMTLRFFLQSEKETLSDGEIDRVMQKILNALEKGCGASLR